MDLDAFYASVEQLRRPELRGKPVIVGGGDAGGGRAQLSRGVVSAASYEARVHGVHSAMPLATALRLCPHAIVVPVDFAAYRAASSAIFVIAREYTPLIEPLSLDEALLDVTGSARRHGPAPQIAALIRDSVLAECSLHASFGVATCKTVAKVASELRKPRGFVVVAAGDEASFLAPLPLRSLPGLGPATETALSGLGIRTLGELAALPLELVQRRVGNVQGRSIWERPRGDSSMRRGRAPACACSAWASRAWRTWRRWISSRGRRRRDSITHSMQCENALATTRSGVAPVPRCVISTGAATTCDRSAPTTTRNRNHAVLQGGGQTARDTRSATAVAVARRSHSARGTARACVMVPAQSVPHPFTTRSYSSSSSSRYCTISESYMSRASVSISAIVATRSSGQSSSAASSVFVALRPSSWRRLISAVSKSCASRTKASSLRCASCASS